MTKTLDDLVRIVKAQRLADEADRASRAPSTLSERMRAIPTEDMSFKDYNKMVEWADEVEALEAELKLCRAEVRGELEWSEEFLRQQAEKDSPTDILKHNYEKLGLSSALVVNNKYGKNSAFGYMREE